MIRLCVLLNTDAFKSQYFQFPRNKTQSSSKIVKNSATKISTKTQIVK